MQARPLLRVKNLSKTYLSHGLVLKAIDNISFEIDEGETLGLVGESGCGKSTLARTLLRLEEPNAGEIFFENRNLASLRAQELKALRKDIQIIFQDPYASLNPRMSAGDIIAEPLLIHKIASGAACRERVEELLHLVGLNSSQGGRFPHEFSGGQRQRIGIARALASNPRFIVCDEPTSALDVSVRAQIINLLKKLQQDMGLTYLFISHDLSLVKYVSVRVAVMYLGHLVELAPSKPLYMSPMHPYTQALLSAIPIPDPAIEKARTRIVLKGEIPSASSSPIGCIFSSRCPYAKERCRLERPAWEEKTPGHFTACHFPLS
ncbi:MAG: ABC transporter ATP-binding protein [Anaerolineae bacterium]